MLIIGIILGVIVLTTAIVFTVHKIRGGKPLPETNIINKAINKILALAHIPNKLLASKSDKQKLISAADTKQISSKKVDLLPNPDKE